MLVAIDAGAQRQIAKQSARMAVGDGGFGQIGVHGRGTHADQNREIMRIEAFRRTDIDAGIGP